MEPVWEVASADEGEAACAELERHGIDHELSGRLVLVPADDVLKALDLLEAWSGRTV